MLQCFYPHSVLREQATTKPEPAMTEDDEDMNNEEEESWDNDEDGDGEDDEDDEDDNDEDTTEEQDTSEQTSNVAMTTTTTTTTESIEEVVRGEICLSSVILPEDLICKVLSYLQYTHSGIHCRNVEISKY